MIRMNGVFTLMSIALVSAVVLALSGIGQPADAASKQRNVLTWCDHTDPELLKPFENQHQVRINPFLYSALAEEAAGLVHERIRSMTGQEGIPCSNRYSPGYCGWKVDEQQILFRLFPEHPLGVTLSDSSLMIPVKSVSGVVASGREVEYHDYSCEGCTMKYCPYRKV